MVLPWIGAALSGVGLLANALDDSDEDRARYLAQQQKLARDQRYEDEILDALEKRKGLYSEPYRFDTSYDGAIDYKAPIVEAQRFKAHDRRQQEMDRLQAAAAAEGGSDVLSVLPFMGSLATAIGSELEESPDDKIADAMAKRGLMKGYQPFDDGEEDTGWRTRDGRPYR